MRIQNTFSSKVDDSCASHLKAYNELCMFFPSSLIGTFEFFYILGVCCRLLILKNNNNNRDAVQWISSYALERVLLCCCDVLFACQRRCLSAAVFRRYANLFSSRRKNMSGKIFGPFSFCYVQRDCFRWLCPEAYNLFITAIGFLISFCCVVSDCTRLFNMRRRRIQQTVLKLLFLYTFQRKVDCSNLLFLKS